MLIDFTAANADTAATIVVIAGVTDFHTSCAAASHANLCVERVYSNIAPSRILSASNADWQCGLADWLYANDLQGALVYKAIYVPPRRCAMHFMLWRASNCFLNCPGNAVPGMTRFWTRQFVGRRSCFLAGQVADIFRVC